MMDKAIKSILYFFKKIQITFRTWRNAIEIARAYAHPSQIRDSLFREFKAGLLRAVAIVVIVVIAGSVLFGINKTVGLRQVPVLLKKAVAKISIRRVPEKRMVKQETVPPDVHVTEKIDETVKTDTMIADSEPAMAEPEESVVDTTEPELEIIKPVIKKYTIRTVKDSGDYLLLLANKAVKALYVLQKQDGSWRVVREYDIAIGEQEGQKQYAGDRRTPEGYYSIVGRKERSELSIIYGPLAYVLDYPNEKDQREGRTGQGIWIHGTDPDSLPLETRGCIEMENSNLRELSSLLKSGIGTPVVIVNKPDLVNLTAELDFSVCEKRRKVVLEEYALVKTEFSLLVTSWKSAWEQKKIEEYAFFYDTLDFSGQGLEWAAWKERKLRTFSLYDTIAISVDNILITDFTDNLTIVKFLQQYSTNLNNIVNGKKLLFKKIDDNWKIMSESTCPKEELLL